MIRLMYDWTYGSNLKLWTEIRLVLQIGVRAGATNTFSPPARGPEGSLWG